MNVNLTLDIEAFVSIYNIWSETQKPLLWHIMNPNLWFARLPTKEKRNLNRNSSNSWNGKAMSMFPSRRKMRL